MLIQILMAISFKMSRFALRFDKYITQITIKIRLIRIFIMFYKQHILLHQYHLYFDSIVHKYTDDHIV